MATYTSFEVKPCSREIIHVIAGLDAIYGGPSRSVPSLCRWLSNGGFTVTLLSVASRGESPLDVVINGYHDRRFSGTASDVPLIAQWRLSSGLGSALREAVKRRPIIHNHGLWLMPNIVSAKIARRADVPLIISTRGMLSAQALKFSHWKKKSAWLLGQGSAIKGAKCLHVTSAGEHDDIRRLGISVPIAIVPNGVEIPLSGTLRPMSNASRTVLFLGRVHPIKGLEDLLRAWSLVEHRHLGWRLRIIGPGKREYRERLIRIASEYKVRRVVFELEMDDDEKLIAYSEADIFIQPSHSESFGLTVAEALGCGVPVICTRGTPWTNLYVRGCGWVVDRGADALGVALEEAMSLPRERLQEMGARGRAWMECEYSWGSIVNRMSELYKWAAGESPAPSSLHFS